MNVKKRNIFKASPDNQNNVIQNLGECPYKLSRIKKNIRKQKRIASISSFQI